MTTSIHLARRVAAISPSPTMAVMAEAMRLRAAGEDVVDFSAGQPDFDTPSVAREAGIQAIESGYTRYTANPGAPDLRAAVADCYRRDFDLDFAGGNVLITSGGKHALTGLLLATCEEGDEVVIPTPYWPTFPEQVKIVGAEPVFARAGEDTWFRPTRAVIEAGVTDRTRAIILNIPGNPSGVVLSPRELEDVAQLALEADAYLLWDDTYSRLTFEPAPEGAYRRMQDILGHRFLVAGGASKTYAMTGMAPRLGDRPGAGDQGRRFVAEPDDLERELHFPEGGARRGDGGSGRLRVDDRRVRAADGADAGRVACDRGGPLRCARRGLLSVPELRGGAAGRVRGREHSLPRCWTSSGSPRCRGSRLATTPTCDSATRLRTTMIDEGLGRIQRFFAGR